MLDKTLYITTKLEEAWLSIKKQLKLSPHKIQNKPFHFTAAAKLPFPKQHSTGSSRHPFGGAKQEKPHLSHPHGDSPSKYDKTRREHKNSIWTPRNIGDTAWALGRLLPQSLTGIWQHFPALLREQENRNGTRLRVQIHYKIVCKNSWAS